MRAAPHLGEGVATIQIPADKQLAGSDPVRGEARAMRTRAPIQTSVCRMIVDLPFDQSALPEPYDPYPY